MEIQKIFELDSENFEGVFGMFFIFLLFFRCLSFAMRTVKSIATHNKVLQILAK